MERKRRDAQKAGGDKWAGKEHTISLEKVTLLQEDCTRLFPWPRSTRLWSKPLTLPFRPVRPCDKRYINRKNNQWSPCGDLSTPSISFSRIKCLRLTRLAIPNVLSSISVLSLSLRNAAAFRHNISSCRRSPAIFRCQLQDRKSFPNGQRRSFSVRTFEQAAQAHL